MVTRAALPSLVIPERRPNEVDGIAIGKELTGLIRGAKTRSAINKALAQHGTLGTPEAIETVRQGMGTWFSDPQKIIELQDTLYTREKDTRDYELEGRKLDVEQDIAEANIAAEEAAAQLVANVETSRYEADLLRETKWRELDETARIENQKEIARLTKAHRDEEIRIESEKLEGLRLNKKNKAALDGLNIVTDSIDTRVENIHKRAAARGGIYTAAEEQELKRLSTRRGEVVTNILQGVLTPEGLAAFNESLDQTKAAGVTEVAKLTEKQIEEQRIKTEKSRISQLPISAVIEQLPDAWWNIKERSDYLRKASEKVASAEEELDRIEEALFNHPDRYIGDSSSAQNNRKGSQKRKRFYENIKKEGEAEIARLRPEAEAYLLEQTLRKSAPQVNQGAALEDTDADFGNAPGLNPQGSVDVIDNVMQLALNSPQGQEMMRRLMEEQQIG
ncbi:MAG: hypothetical protein ACKJRP_04285 [SAR86 cluster bacterium]|tara:strand:+ start:16776 stop:18119 length:1344 start_codon:yes stop_codon:yes gene_type:complete